MKKIDELRKLDLEKLLKELEDTVSSYFKVSFDIKNGQAKNTHEIRQHRRQIARIKTIIKEKRAEKTLTPTEDEK